MSKIKILAPLSCFLAHFLVKYKQEKEAIAMDEILATKAKLIEMETAAFYSCLKIMNKSGMALLLVSDNSQKRRVLLKKV